ncbi:MAG: ABC-2 family transporter protein [Phycisphaerae bacterium]|nr:ABC-2 family transporter protein [Phycisphaerae bacterium]
MCVVRAFLAYLRAGVGVMFQYRGEIFLWTIWGLVNPAVLYAMWSSAAEGNTDATVAGFDRGGFAAYYFIIMIVGHFTTAWDVYEIGYLIRTGKMSPLLLRPILPIWKALADNVAYKASTLMFTVPMWCLFAWLVKPTLHTAIWQLGLGAVALVLSAALNFILGYTVALVAFWVTKLDAAGEVYFGLGMFLGGRFAPLAALKEPLHSVAAVLPFRWMYAFPTELLTGKTARPADGLAGIACQVIWLGVALVAFRVLWAAAVKRYAAVGG